MSVKEIGRLLGAWRLTSYEARDSTRQLDYPLGEHVTGQLIYDADGNMSTHMMRDDRPTFASNDPAQGTDAEVRAAFEGHFSYFGTYTVNPGEQTVTHHVQGCSYPNWIGNDQVRYYSFDDARLLLSTPPIVFRGQSFHSVLIWERTS
jgi:hypothetical protein